MTRVLLPKYYSRSGGTLIEDFNDTDWVIIGDDVGTVTAQDTTHYLVGSSALKFDHPVGETLLQASKTGLSIDMSDMKSLTFWFYLDGNSDSFDIQIFLETDTSNYVTHRFESDKVLPETGWFSFKVAKDDFTATLGTITWSSIANIRVRVEDSSVYTDGTQTFTIWADAIYMNVRSRPKLMIRFDDGIETHYTIGYTYMNAYNLVGNIAVYSDRFGETGGLTNVQMQAMYDAGWGISNHSSDGLNYGAATDDADWLDKIKTCKNAIEANGWTGHANYVVWPGCIIRKSGVGTFAKTILQQNGFIFGSQCVGSIQNELIPVEPHPADSTKPGINNYMCIYGKMHSSDLADDNTTNKAYVDKLISTGSSGQMTFHGLSGATGLGITQAHFEDVIDHIALRRNQGLIDVVTFKEFHESHRGY